MQAFSIYKQLVLVWIHRLTGYLLIAGAGFIGTLSFLHYIGAEFNSVAETWFGFDVESSNIIFWLHTNPGTAAIVSIFVAIIGSKFTVDSNPLISGLTVENEAAQRSKAVRFELQDILAELKDSLNDLTIVGNGAEKIVAYRKKQVSRITELLQSVNNMSPAEADLLDPEEIIRAKGMAVYAHHQGLKTLAELQKLEILISDLDTAVLLCEKTTTQVNARSKDLHKRLIDATVRAQDALDRLPQTVTSEPVHTKSRVLSLSQKSVTAGE